jgi:hypothetical protein
MAAQQGSARVSARKGKILLTAHSIITQSAWTDEHGVLRGATATDFDAYSKLLSVGVTRMELGQHLRAALLASRIDRPSDWYDPSRRDGTAKLAHAFGLKSASSVYQGMTLVSASWEMGTITLLPTIRRFRAGFDYYPKEESNYREVTAPFDAATGTIGQALEECLTRCR